MFDKIRRLLLAATLAPLMVASLPAASPAEVDLSGSNFYFRYRAGGEMVENTTPIEAKDIVAFFMGGVGLEFSEKLPIKPKWIGLTWKLVDGTTLPKGIKFDNATRIFSGIPTEVSRRHVIQMVGYNADGSQEATAQVTFDIFEVLGEPFDVTLYAHTGKYKYDVLPSPKDGVVDQWAYDQDFVPPPGIKVNGPYYEGIPTTPGTYNIHLQGVDYKKDVIATYFVKYIVEDGPTFDVIPDDVRRLAPAGTIGWHWSGYFNFGAPSPYSVLHKIDPQKNVKYFLRIDSVDGLPGDVSTNNNPDNLRIEGFVLEPFDTGTAHFHAIDSDGTVGDSNVFRFGTADPTPQCKYSPYAPEKVVFVTGTEAQTQLAVPFGSQGTPRFVLTDGTLPDGLRLEDGGRIVGVPMTAQSPAQVSIRVDILNGETVTTSPNDCRYMIEVVNKKLKLYDATAAQAQHGRVGAPYSGLLKVTGGIPDFVVDWTPGTPHPTLNADLPATNASTMPVVGTFDLAELPHKYSFNMMNGDGNPTTGSLSLFGHATLSFGDPSTFVPNFTVTRLGQSGNWGAIPYDADTVVPDTSGATTQPILMLDQPSSLPSGVTFNGRVFQGLTQQPEGQYGPFRVNMSDFTGENILSDPFFVQVAHRDEIVIKQFVPPVFIVEQLDVQELKAPIAGYPPGAESYTRTWKLEGPALPTWAHFNTATGQFTADAAIPYNDLKQPANQTLYGPYTVTVSDDDPLTPSTSAPTAAFFITLQDMPSPAADTIHDINGTVSGDAQDGIVTFAKSLVGLKSAQQKTVTSVSVHGLPAMIDTTTIVGTRDQVVFTGSDPAAPAGLQLQISADGHDAWFEGSPTEAYKGTVKAFFKDIRGRVGHVPIQMEIKPYPTVKMTAESYDLPRLAPAEDYGINPAAISPTALFPSCPDCWTPPKWSLETLNGPLPSDLSVRQSSGVIFGQTKELDDQTPDNKSPFAGVVLKATSMGANGEELVSWTQPFTINIKPRVPMTLTYPDGKDTWYLNDRSPTTGYTFNKRDMSKPHVGGSSNPVVGFEADLSALTAGQGFDKTNGVATWNLSSLGLGEWTPLVTATDSDGQQASDTLAIKATLAGAVEVLQGSADIRLRQSEPFLTDDLPHRAHVPTIVVDHAVGDMSYTLSGAPDTTSIIATSGSFVDGSRIDAAGNYNLMRSGTDADGRSLDHDVKVHVEVVKPLAFAGPAPAEVKGRQYDPATPISFRFPSVDFAMGKLSYRIEALSAAGIPGQIVYKVYDPQETTFLYWHWVDADSREHLLDAKDSRGLSNEDKLPLDALVFDPANLSLTGIPSKPGSFAIGLVAVDDYMDGYLHVDDIHPLERRVENNTSVSGTTLVVADALPLTIAMKTADGDGVSETIHQYTQRPSLRGETTGAAYGRPMTWELVSGTLPKGLSPYASGTNLAFGSYADQQGAFPGIVVKGTDAAGRTILTTQSAQGAPVAFTVIERDPLQLLASENPRRMAVNLTDADLTVTPTGLAYGTPPADSDWVITGEANLPPGVRVAAANGIVHFSGIATTIGEYGPVNISAKDALGATASISIRFTVRIPDGRIVLNVSDGRIKPTYPYAMVATSSNTYGTVAYNSYAINSTYKSDLKINSQSGRVEGVFQTPQKVQFDVWVTDSTNRVTSAPVTVEVIPFVRVTVPETVRATETKPMTQTVTTDYVLGTVRYTKGKGTWPNGLVVDPLTGTISGTAISTAGTTNAAPGDYAGLTITATDTFVDYDGNMHTDVKDSNTFKIALDGIPDIADIDSTTTNRKLLYTRDVAITPLVPTVIDAVTKGPFTIPETFYSINKDLEGDTGLLFDSKTGVISGTPTKLVVYSDFAITVTSPNGNSDTTKPFYLAVQPQGRIDPTPGQKDRYVQRVGEMFTTNQVSFDNTVGDVVRKLQTTSKVTLDPTTGAVATRTASALPAGLSFNAQTGAVSGTATAAGDYEFVVQATDGAGRTATFTYVVQIRGALALSLTKPNVGLNIGQTYAAINTPTATNVGGKATFAMDGLPNGMTFSTTDGSLSGSPSPEYVNGTKFTIHMKMTDSYDGQFRELSYVVTVALPILPEAGQRTAYNIRIDAPFSTDMPKFTNAVGSVSFATADGPLGLSGIAVDPSTGLISGTPTFVAFGRYPNYVPATDITILTWSPNLTIVDSTGRTGTLPFTITIRRPLTLAVSNPIKGIDFGRTYAALNVPTAAQAGGALTYDATGLPDGLSVNRSTGGLDGVVAQGAYPVGQTFDVKVTATDSFDGTTASASYTLTVADPITVPTGQTVAYVGRIGDVIRADVPKFENAYGAVTLTQTGKPAWMTFNAADGTTTGTVTTATTGTTTITLTDSIGRSKTFAYDVTTKPALGLALTPTVNGVDIGTTYAAFNTPTASGVGGTAAFEDVGGKVQATGLTFNTATGAVSGSPDASIAPATAFQALVKVTDTFDTLRQQLVQSGNVTTPAGDATPFSRTVTYPLTVASKIVATAGQPPVFATRVGDAFKTVAGFDNTIGTVTFTQTGKPAALAFDATTATLSGTLAAVADSTVTVTVKDATGRSASLPFTLRSKAALGLTLANPVNGLDFGRSYSATNVPAATAVAGVSRFEDFNAVVASTGLTFDPTKGGFSGTLDPSIPVGTPFDVTVRLTDDYDVLRMQQVMSGYVTTPAADLTPNYREVKYTLTAANAIIVPAGQKAAYIGRVTEAFTSEVPRFDNTLGTVTYTATGVPSGLSINPTTGAVSGTIATAATSTITVTAKDGTGRTATFAYTLTTKGVLTITVPTLTTEIRQSVGKPYTAINRPTTTNVGGTLRYTASGLPSEFTIDETTGAITGVVARSTYPDGTTFNVTVRVADSFDAHFKDVQYVLTAVNAPAPGIAVTYVSTGYSAVAAATVTPVYTDVKNGDVVELAPGSAPLPPGFSIVKSGSTWVLQKTATTNADVGVYKGINLRVTDVDGLYGETGPQDVLLRSAAFLAYPNVAISSRTLVPVETGVPTPSAGLPIKDVSFAFSKDTTGGNLKIDPATGEITGWFTANGTNIVTVTESYDGKTIRTFNYNVTLTILPLSLTMADVAALTGEPIDGKYAPTVQNTLGSGAFSLSGAVPSWLSVDPNSGALSGTPDQASVGNVTLTYQDAWGTAAATFKVGATGGVRGFKYVKFEKASTIRTLMREFRLFDEYGTDVMKYASIYQQSPAGTNFSVLFDGSGGTAIDNTGDANVVFVFPTRINFAKATYQSNTYESYCVWAPGQTTNTCPSPGWAYLNAPARVYGSNNGVDFVQIGSAAQTGQTIAGSLPVAIPLTQQ
jgi:hypothetical protein